MAPQGSERITPHDPMDDIIITGISGKFPLSDNILEFQTNLFEKVDMVTSSAPRYKEGIYGLPKRIGVIKDLSKFDPTYFAISPMQAESMDPMSRILLESSCEALIDAGYHPAEVHGKNYGVYVGCSVSESNDFLSTNLENKTGYAVSGCNISMFSNRISYSLDLKGPSLSLDTACSSTGMALFLAIQSILSGECDGAFVGGSNLVLRPFTSTQFYHLKMTSVDGKCKSFDADGKGYVRSETVGMVLIQKRRDARRSYARIVDIRTNNDGGNKPSITFPSGRMQAELLNQVYRNANVDPLEVKYVETHGTGTTVGDPEEASALSRAFLQKKRNQPLLLGSVKSNCGHSESASGICSIAKIITIMETGYIPPNLHFKNPNPNIKELVDGQMRVVTEVEPFPGNYIAFNQFGFGGVNVHTLFEKNLERVVPKDHVPYPRLVLWFGRTEDSLKNTLRSLVTPRKSPAFYGLVQKVASVSDPLMYHRGFAITDGREPTEPVVQRNFENKPQLWFVYSGMGSQWPGMAKSMMQLPVFEQSIARSAKILKPHGIDLYKLILEDIVLKERSIIPAFVAIASIQVALTDLLFSMGLRPDGLIGHSVGELGCAYADGCFTAEQMVLAAYWRGRAIEDNMANLELGAMAAVGLSWDEVKQTSPAGIEPSCDNAEDSITISGPKALVHSYIEELQQKKVFAREVNSCSYGFHSKYIQSSGPLLLNSMKKLITDPKPRTPRWVSTSIPKERWAESLALTASAEYFVNNLLSPVRFRDGLEQIPDNAVVVEIGPHCLLQALLKRGLKTHSVALGLMKRGHADNVHFFLENVGKMYNTGLTPAIEALYPPVNFPVPRGTEPLSPYMAWDHSQDWLVANWENHPMATSNGEVKFNLELDSDEFKHMAGHYIDGRVLVPATGYLVLVWRALAQLTATDINMLPVHFRDVSFHRATILPPSGKTILYVSISPAEGNFEIRDGETAVVTGRVAALEGNWKPDTVPELDPAKLVLNKDDIYQELALRGYQYRPPFQGLQNSSIDATQGKITWNGKWDVFMDTMLHISILTFSKRMLYLPTRVVSVKIDPTLHKDIQEGSDIPIHIDPYVNKIIAGGIQVEGLKCSLAPRRTQPNREPILEEYTFLPYHRQVKDERLLEYIHVCASICRTVLEKIGKNKAQIENLINGSNENVQKYLTSVKSDQVYLKILKELSESTLTESTFGDILQKFVEQNKLSFKNDLVNSSLTLNHNMLRSSLEIAFENITAGTVSICEISNETSISEEVLPMIETFICMRKAEYNVATLSSEFDQKLHKQVKCNFAWDGESERAEIRNADVLILNQTFSEKLIEQIREITKPSAFIILVQRTELISIETFFAYLGELTLPFTPLNKIEKALSGNFEILSKNFIESVGTVMLLRRPHENITMANQAFIEVSNGDYEKWVEPLKQKLVEYQDKPEGHNIWLYSKEANSGIVGLVNCLIKEPGGHKVRCIYNLSHPSQTLNNLEASFEEILKFDLVMNIIKDGRIGSFRLLALTQDHQVPFYPAFIDQETNGDLSSFRWHQSRLRHEDPSHLVNVCYSALNFRDIMMATGRLSLDTSPVEYLNKYTILGLEYSGIRASDGARVMGIVGYEGLATAVKEDSKMQWKVPASWSMAQAATVPIAYMTAYYSFFVRGRMRRGDSVLIHSGTGALGQAAIHIALSMDCEVFVTVGTKEKREFLHKHFPQIRDDHISDSRSLQFETDILRITKGQGVKYVLNSLAEDKLQATLRCLKDDGHFLEVGKYDMYNNSPLGMSVFTKNTTFHGVLLDILFIGREAHVMEELGQMIRSGLESGVVKPIHHAVFSSERIEDAFRYMAAGKHIGKILIKIRDETSDTVPRPPALPVTYLHPHRTYIITGGLGGFGLELADWLVQRGAQHLVLTSRRGVTSGYQRLRLAAWEADGVKVTVSKLDASKRQECEALLKQVDPPVGGIFNLAMVLQDAIMENQSPEKFAEVCQPKVNAARHLDRISRERCPHLEWFVCFSSVSCGRGNPGQSNYGMANSAMERVCEGRRRDGLHGLSIQWGIIGDVGVVHRTMGADVEVGGTVAQPIISCLKTLDKFMGRPEPVLSSVVPALRDEDKWDQKGGATKSLKAAVAHILGIKDLSKVDFKASLNDLGLDSLMGVEIKQTLSRIFELDLSIQEIRKMNFEKLEELEKTVKTTQTTENKGNMDKTLLNLDFLVKPKESILHLNQGKSGLAYFFIPPIEGRADVFAEVASHFDRPVIGVQEITSMPLDIFDNYANYFLEHIKTIQPKGPYSIIGYSFGTIAAIEVARKLVAAGERVEQLVLIDGSKKLFHSYSGSYKERFGEEFEREAESEYLSILLQEVAHQMKTKAKESLFLLTTYEERLRATADSLFEKSDRDHSIEELVNACHVQYRKMYMEDQFVPPARYPGDVTLIKATRSVVKADDVAEDYGLSEVCSGKIKIHTLEATHHNIIQGENAKKVAALILKA